jgi:hypothetical protein
MSAKIENAADVGMSDTQSKLNFALKRRYTRRPVSLSRSEGLEGDPLLQLLIVALVNLTHSAAPNQAAHFETAGNEFARREEVLFRSGIEEPLSTTAVHEDSARAIVLAKEFFDLSAQISVVAA